MEGAIPAKPADRRRMDRLLHGTFEASILLKGFFAVIEVIGGVALGLVGSHRLQALVNRMTLRELAEDPSDHLANVLLHTVQGFSIQSQHFYAIYLATHGLVKLVLVIGLLRGARWSYPVAMAVLSLFVVYQVYRFSYTHAIGLLVLTVFDLFVIALIWREYRARQRQAMA